VESTENLTSVEIEQPITDSIVKPLNVKGLDESPRRNIHVSNYQTEPGKKQDPVEVQELPSSSPTFQDLIRYNT
jgi:DNA-binding NtrC family response regulator